MDCNERVFVVSITKSYKVLLYFSSPKSRYIDFASTRKDEREMNANASKEISMMWTKFFVRLETVVARGWRGSGLSSGGARREPREKPDRWEGGITRINSSVAASLNLLCLAPAKFVQAHSSMFINREIIFPPFPARAKISLLSQIFAGRTASILFSFFSYSSLFRTWLQKRNLTLDWI